jgi:hypothetical protein
MQVHLLLLLIDIAAMLCVLSGLLAVLWRGFQVARVGRDGSKSDGLIRWNEAINPMQSSASLVRRKMRLFARILQFKVKAGRAAMLSESIIADPVDGTVFQPGEILVRCACGTSYHQHSWQWLGQKNQGKCVNCKRAGLISTRTLPQLRTAL